MASRRGALLELCANGLRETRHPYATVARLAFTDLVTMQGAEPLEEEQLKRVVEGLRLALAVETATGAGPRSPAASTSSVFEPSLTALRQVAAAEGPRLVPYL